MPERDSLVKNFGGFVLRIRAFSEDREEGHVNINTVNVVILLFLEFVFRKCSIRLESVGRTRRL